jgi:hypothetical protein
LKLACIAHPPRRMSDAGSGRSTLRLRRKIPVLFGEKSTVCFDENNISTLVAPL